MSKSQEHSDFPLSFPGDIWLQIVRHGLDDFPTRRDMISLASTNKFIRGIAFPALFHELKLYGHDDEPYYLKKFIRRVRALKSLPIILNAICRLSLISLSICPRDDQDSEEDSDLIDLVIGAGDSESDSDRASQVSQLHPVAYREVITLLSSLPRLYHLGCWDCSFVPEFFFHILRIPNLRSFYIHEPWLYKIDPIKFQVAAPSLHIFQYYLGLPLQQCPSEDIKLFISLINQFTVFSIPLDFLPHILVNDSLPIALPKLRKLSIHGPWTTQDDHSILMHIRSFLDLTPNLCELRIVGYIHIEIPFILPDTMVPHLKTLMSPPCIANGIASIRMLDKLHILAFDGKNFQDSYTVVSRGIKHVLYNGSIDEAEDLIHLARVFPNASIVEIVVMEDSSWTREQLSDMVLTVLPKFGHLKQCIVSEEGDQNYGDYYCPPACCPVGCVDDPRYRSHPTLEELCILSCHRWTWCPEVGWLRSPDVTCVPYTTDLKFFVT